MANTETIIVKSASASVDASTGMVAPQISGKILGEDVAGPCTPMEIRSDGLLWRATATAADSHARVAGFSTRRGKTGQPMTIYGIGTVMKYADETMTPGALVFLGDTVGTLSSTATTGDAVGVAQAIDASNIRVTRAI